MGHQQAVLAASETPWWVTLIASILSGFAGAAAVRIYDALAKRAEDKDRLIAALRVVRYELAANSLAATSATDLRDDTYRSVQLILARHLSDQPLREKLPSTYALIAPARAGELSIQSVRDAMRDREAEIEAELSRRGAG